MLRTTQKKQAGFAFIIILIAVAAVGSIGTIGYAKVKESQNDKIAAQKQEQSNQIAIAAKAKAELKKAEKKDETVPVPEVTPAPAVTPAPVVAPTTKPAAKPIVTPNITSFISNDAESCDSYVAAYASKTGGTPLYNTYVAAYNGVDAKQTIPYGAYLQIKCKDGNAAMALYNGIEGVVNTDNVSKTKP